VTQRHLSFGHLQASSVGLAFFKLSIMLFKDIIGQQAVKKHLIRTVELQRISHAQLFLGPPGSGKLALAVAYAQFINCQDKQNFTAENAEEADSCGTCPSCLKYQKLAHPDLHFIYPVASTKEVSKPLSKEFLVTWREKLLDTHFRMSLNDWYENIGIEKKQAVIHAEDCNEIIRTLSYKSYESEYKVMIIWMVEKLFHAAAPKILKILEEPPDKTLFLLISENQDLIIKTILSRLQLVKVPKTDDESLKKILLQRHECTPEHVSKILALADGNYIEAVKILERGEEEFSLFTSFRDWMRLCFRVNIEGIYTFVTDLAKQGREQQKLFLNYASRMMRNTMLFRFQHVDIARVNKDEKDFLQNFAPFISADSLFQIADELEKAQHHIERNANPGITFMDLSLTIVSLLKAKQKATK